MTNKLQYSIVLEQYETKCLLSKCCVTQSLIVGAKYKLNYRGKKISHPSKTKQNKIFEMSSDRKNV